jgi:hypothetical protein
MLPFSRQGDALGFQFKVCKGYGAVKKPFVALVSITLNQPTVIKLIGCTQSSSERNLYQLGIARVKHFL